MHALVPNTQVITRMLHMIPLTVVETRKEVDEVKELVSICRNYNIALRCELKRKVRRANSPSVIVHAGVSTMLLRKCSCSSLCKKKHLLP